MDTFLVTHFCTLLAIPRCSVCWKSKKISCNVLPCSAWMRLSLSVSLQTNIMLTYTGIACHLSQRIVVYRDISDNMLPSSLSLSWQLGRWSTSSGHEIADYLNEIETLYEELLLTCAHFFCHKWSQECWTVGPFTFFVVEDPGFSGREMAALVASKVFYHLEEPMTKVDLSRMNRHWTDYPGTMMPLGWPWEQDRSEVVDMLYICHIFIYLPHFSRGRSRCLSSQHPLRLVKFMSCASKDSSSICRNAQSTWWGP